MSDNLSEKEEAVLRRDLALAQHYLKTMREELAVSQAEVLALREKNHVLRARAVNAQEQLRILRASPTWILSAGATRAAGVVKESGGGLVRLARQIKRRTLG